MPELPEVESLAAFLRGHAIGHAVARADAASFSVLKTFDPPLASLSGQMLTDVGRHGKFLDISSDQGLHLIMHLARAGWLRWRDEQPATPPKPGKSPLAFRLTLDDGSGFDLTELRGHAIGYAVARADAASFSVLKPFAPPLASLSGQMLTDVGRHGKFLDISSDQGLHLIMHLARAGC